MKFTPREIKSNVNISPTSPVKDFFELVIKILGFILAIYVLLGFTVDHIAPRISTNTELKLGKLFSARFGKKERTPAELQLQQILDELVKKSQGLPPFNYKVYVEESKDINALALPGGNIVVLSALFKEVDSKNALAMVLAHELGHFYHRDHLRGLGRSLVFLLISSALLGSDGSASKVVTNAVTNAEMRFSQVQEKAADLYALDLLNKTYGSVAGATDFFEKMSRKEKLWSFFYIFASHPYPASRIVAIKENIKLKGYVMGQKIPLAVEIKKVSSKNN
jgi:predicted Zn-dependent protease